MIAWCKSCKCKVVARRVDHSFTHAFGLEVVEFLGCDICEGNVFLHPSDKYPMMLEELG